MAGKPGPRVRRTDSGTRVPAARACSLACWCSRSRPGSRDRAHAHVRGLAPERAAGQPEPLSRVRWRLTFIGLAGCSCCSSPTSSGKLPGPRVAALSPKGRANTPSMAVFLAKADSAHPGRSRADRHRDYRARSARRRRSHMTRHPVRPPRSAQTKRIRADPTGPGHSGRVPDFSMTRPSVLARWVSSSRRAARCPTAAGPWG